MNFFLQPFWYVEYENIHFRYYSKLEDFKKYSIEFSDEERKKESGQLNELHSILNKIRSQYNSYFCSNYKDFENLFDFQVKCNKSHRYFTLTMNDKFEESEEFEEPQKVNLTIL